MRLVLVLLLALASPCLAEGSALEEIAPGVHMLIHEEPAAKSIVAEFERFLVVVESPGDEANARTLFDVTAEAFPDKPVRFVLHTHHHGHSIGVLDPFLVRGVTVVTSEKNLDLIRGRSIDPERFDRAAFVVADGFALEDATNRLVVHVLDGSHYTVPTDEYVVVEFPDQELLVSGCLYNKPLTYHEVVNQRKPALRLFLRTEAPHVKTLVPTNSSAASGFENVCTVAMLDATLEEGIQPTAVAERLAAMELDELTAKLDELAEEFGARTPRSYDLLVTGNTIRSLDDHARAALWFEMTARIFPDEGRVHYYHGLALWESGAHEAAEAAWDVARSLSPEDSRERLESSIARAREGT